jgi:hypothetical protein
MTTSREAALPHEVTAWAARTLEVEQAAGGPAVRAAFLRKLPDEDFVPPAPWRPALEVLSGRETAHARPLLYNQFVEETAPTFRDQVESFAIAFFSLPPDQRAKRYDELRETAECYPAIAARLQRLEKGLELDSSACDGPDPDTSHLATGICEAFVLPPIAAAARRQELLFDCQRDLPRWEAAARRLCKARPQIVALEHDLVQKLLLWQDEKKRLQKKKLRPPVAASASSGTSASPLRYSWLIFVVIMAIARAISSSSSTSSRVPDPPPIQINPDMFRQPNQDLQRTMEKLEKLRKQQEDLRRLPDDLRKKQPDPFFPQPPKPPDDFPGKRKVEPKPGVANPSKKPFP